MLSALLLPLNLAQFRTCPPATPEPCPMLYLPPCYPWTLSQVVPALPSPLVLFLPIWKHCQWNDGPIFLCGYFIAGQTHSLPPLPPLILGNRSGSGSWQRGVSKYWHFGKYFYTVLILRKEKILFPNTCCLNKTFQASSNTCTVQYICTLYIHIRVCTYLFLFVNSRQTNSIRVQTIFYIFCRRK